LLVAGIAIAALLVMRKPPAKTAEATDASSLEAAAPTEMPYLPARSAPDDSFAPPSQVEAVLFRLKPGLALCYRAPSHDNPNIVANAIFTVQIGGDGHVVDAKLGKSDAPIDPTLVQCVERTLYQGLFKPTPDGGVETVQVPISFRPPRGGWKDAGGF